jgi:hypothetical protein
MSFNPKSVRNVKNELVESNPDISIESGFSFGVGALTIDFVDFAFVHDESLDLSKISRAEVGVYEINLNKDIDSVEMPKATLTMKNCPEEQVVIRVREPNERVQVSACIKKNKVTGLSVFVLEPSELVVVNARGDFEALLSKLVKSSKQRDEADNDNVVAGL